MNALCIVLTVVIYFFNDANGLVCLTNILSTDILCDEGVDFCIEIDCIIQGGSFKFQGCDNQISLVVDGVKPLKNCTEVGTKTFDFPGLTGQYDCCNTDLCNNKTLNPDARTPTTSIPQTTKLLATTTPNRATNHFSLALNFLLIILIEETVISVFA